MRELLPFLITGMVSGSLYGLAGVGLVLTYRTSGVFNFGHGAIGAGAAFLFYTLHVEHGLAWPMAALLTVVVFGIVVGWVMERITRGLGDVPEAVVVMSTVGILVGVQGLLFVQYGPATRSFPDFLPTSGFEVADVGVTWAQVISVVIASGSAVLLYLFLRRHRLGVAMRAVVDDPALVGLSGDSPIRVRQYAWAIGSGFAALSGILLGPTLGLDATLLTLLVVQAFGACAIGLFKSLPLTYLGGIAVGVLASLATKYFSAPPFNGVPPAVPFLVLVVVLLIVPPRYFPNRRASRRDLGQMAAPRSIKVSTAMAAPALVALAIVPAVVDTYLSVWIFALTNVIVFASLSLLVWGSGQLSLCHAAFLAVGICAMSRLMEAGVPWAPALLLAGLITAPVGALVAVPAVRLSGLYLALATLGFGVLMQFVAFPSDLMFGTDLNAAAPRPQLGAFDGANDRHFYYVVLVLAVATIAGLAAIARSRLGRLLRVLAETPTMLATNGLGLSMTRLLAFSTSAFLAGIAGALIVTQFGFATTTTYGPIQSMVFLAVLCICGTRLLRSPILAAGLATLLPGYADGFDIDRQLLAFGVFAVLAGIVIARRADLRDFLVRGAPRLRSRPGPRRHHVFVGDVMEGAEQNGAARVGAPT